MGKSVPHNADLLVCLSVCMQVRKVPLLRASLCVSE